VFRDGRVHRDRKRDAEYRAHEQRAEVMRIVAPARLTDHPVFEDRFSRRRKLLKNWLLRLDFERATLR
jgi:hypothetical protein